MRVRTVDGKETDGLRLLLAVIEHAEAVPDGPWAYSAVQGALVDPTGAVWMKASEGCSVQRVLLLPCRCACAELTTYRHGVEISRIVGPTR
jgi:hypothetical protein